MSAICLEVSTAKLTMIEAERRLRRLADALQPVMATTAVMFLLARVELTALTNAP